MAKKNQQPDLNSANALIAEFIASSVLIYSDPDISGRVVRNVDLALNLALDRKLTELTELAKKQHPDKAKEFAQVSKLLKKDLDAYVKEVAKQGTEPDNFSFAAYSLAASEASKGTNSQSLTEVGLTNTAQLIDAQIAQEKAIQIEKAAKEKQAAEAEKQKKVQTAKDTLSQPNIIKSQEQLISVFVHQLVEQY